MTSPLASKRKEFIQRAMKRMLGRDCPTATELARATSPSEKGHWSKIINGKTTPGIEKIEALSRILSLDSSKLNKLFVAAARIHEKTDVDDLLRDLFPAFALPNFLPALKYFFGRSEELKEVKSKLLDPEESVIGIIGFPGTGKTTFINQLIRELHKEKNQFSAVAWEVLEPQIETGNPPKFKDVLNSLLTWLSKGSITKETTLQDSFAQITERLITLLKNEQCLIVFDNAETVLATEIPENVGYFSSDCVEYSYLFKQLTKSEHNSKVILTSRESFIALTGPGYSETFLKGLELEAALGLIQYWSQQGKKKYFRELEGTNENFIQLANHYLESPKALELIVPLIQCHKEFNGNIKRFLEASPPTTYESVIKEVIARLSDLEKDCLSKISVYQSQKYSLSREGIHAQVPLLNSNQLTEIIFALERRQLMTFDSEELGYKIHPFIKEKAYNLLKNEAIIAHEQAAKFYLNEFSKEMNSKKIEAAFQAINHFYFIGQYQKCYEILIFKALDGANLNNLRCSANLWNNVDRIMDIIPRLSKYLPNTQQALLLIPLGVIYSEAGKNQDAIQTSQQILSLIKEVAIRDEAVNFSNVAANLIAGRANRLIGKFTESLKACQKASKLAKQCNQTAWQALALYELGLVDLEIDKPRRAIACFIAAAFKGIGQSKVPNGIHSFTQLNWNQLKNINQKIENTVSHYSKANSEDHTKIFRILFNIARGLNLMKLYPVSLVVLNIAEKFVKDTDKGSPVWLYTEFATCHVGMNKSLAAENYYEKSYLLRSTAPAICNVINLAKYGDWHYHRVDIDKALEKYKELEELLEKAEFPFWQAHCYYSQTSCYYHLSIHSLTNRLREKEKAICYLEKTQKVYKRLGLTLPSFVKELEQKLLIYS
jgi:GTPase SAR1 family protein